MLTDAALAVLVAEAGSALITSSSSNALGLGAASKAAAEGGRKEGTYLVVFLLDRPTGAGAA